MIPVIPIDQTEMRQFLLGPAWRWRTAIELSGAPRTRNDECSDEVSTAEDYIRMLENSPSRAKETYPLIDQAKNLWNNVALRERLTIMTLAGLEPDEMAKRLNVTREIIETCELLFLDVRGSRAATDWIHAHVLSPEVRSGSFDAAAQFRMAFSGGPKAAERILDCTDHEWMLQLKTLAALEIPMTTARESLQLQRLYVEQQHKSNRLKFESEKLKARTELENRKLDLAERKMKAREERAQLRAERQRLANLAKSGREQFQEAEQLARIERAMNSPLAALTFKSKATAVSPSGAPPTAQRRSADAVVRGRTAARRPIAARNRKPHLKTRSQTSTPERATAESEIPTNGSGIRVLQDSLVEA